MKIKVSKFGGVCLSSPENIIKVKEIVESDKNRLIVVISAPGQRNSNDRKITDLLYDCYNEILSKGNCNSTFAIIEKRFTQILEFFKLNHFKSKLTEIKTNIEQKKDINFTAAQGEFFTAMLVSEILGFKFVDASSLIKFNANGKVNFNKTYKNIGKITNNLKQGIVIPGFYGALPNGNLLTFSRDGTDYTASLVAGATKSVYENFKDVSMMATNPALIENPVHIAQISYKELRELSYMGAKILHPNTVLPLLEKNIPIIVKSIYSPNGQKTIISNKTEKISKIKAFTQKNGLTLILIKKIMDNDEVDFLHQCFKILKNLDIKYALIDSGIDEIKLLISSSDFQKNQAVLLEQLYEIKPTNLKVEQDISLITIVGNNIFGNKNLIKIINKSLTENNIGVKLLKTNGNSNLIIGICQKDLLLATQIIYSNFFESK